MRRTALTSSPWLFGPLLGAAVGLPVLGVGGRIAMRAIALVTHAPVGFSVEGTVTVILAGVASGAGGGLVYAILHRLLPHSGWARTAFFSAVLLLLTLRGLRPVQPLSLAAFMPLVLLYGTAVEVAWRRWGASARSAEAAA